jgi:hypothetical protein
MIRITQEAVETLLVPTTANARMTQCAVEILNLPQTRSLRASQLAVEVLRTSAGAPASASSTQPIIFVIAG